MAPGFHAGSFGGKLRPNIWAVFPRHHPGLGQQTGLDSNHLLSPGFSTTGGPPEPQLPT